MPFSNVPDDKQDEMHSCVLQMKDRGHTEDAAVAICYTSVVEGLDLDKAIEAHAATTSGDQTQRDVQADLTAPFAGQRATLSELALSPQDTTGHVWEIVIIGPATPDDVVNIDGEPCVRSKNGRYYAASALAAAAPLFEGCKSYDDHLTNEEFQARSGMRPPGKDWLASIVQPRWDRAALSLTGLYKVVDDAFAQKLVRAKDLGVLNTIGLSLDVFQDGVKRQANGQTVEVIKQITRVNSVDAVGTPAAGGGFVRLLEAISVEVISMDLVKQIEQLMAAIDASLLPDEAKAALKGELDKVKAEAGEAPEQPGEAPAMEQKVIEAKIAVLEGVIKRQIEAAAVKPRPQIDPAVTEARRQAEQAMSEARQLAEQAKAESTRIIEAARLSEAQRTLDTTLADSGLTVKAREIVRSQFAGRVFESGDLARVIEQHRAVLLDLEERGTPIGHGFRPTIKVGRVTEADRYQLDLLRLMMGTTRFNAFDVNAKDAGGRGIFDAFKDLGYTRAVENWAADGKPALPRSMRLSNWYYELTGGGVMSEGDIAGTGHFSRRAVEANLTTATLASLVKNAVNIILAAEYSVRQQWWDEIVEQEDVDTIDQATLVRLFGSNTLSVVPEGSAYTELSFADEEETASFYKRGNFIGVTLETFLRDKLNKLQRIPTVLANSWYNTVGARVAAVFTIKSAAGPTLSDTGALFNATALGTAGGHANLRTGALSFSEVTAVITAMKKQTDQPLGAGERLGSENAPKYLLTPIDLSTTADQIINTQNLPGSANNDINPHFQKFKAIEVPNWTDATDWAMLAKPMGRSPINLIWLRGRRTPELVENTDEATGGYFTNDELRFKVRKFMAEMVTDGEYCAPVSDYRSVHKNNVAG